MIRSRSASFVLVLLAAASLQRIGHKGFPDEVEPARREVLHLRRPPNTPPVSLTIELGLALQVETELPVFVPRLGDYEVGPDLVGHIVLGMQVLARKRHDKREGDG